jgi:hypothetical protein
MYTSIYLKNIFIYTLIYVYIGTGWQLLLLVFAVIVYAMAGPILHGNMYEDRGEMVRIFMYMYKYVSFYISLNLYTSRHYLYIFIILCILI